MPLSHVMQFSPVNVMRGIVPVASIWDTDPTNLQNCTDGDVNTVTGTGSKVMGVAGIYGYLVFDLGSIKTVLVGGKYGIWCTTGSIYIFVEDSDDNVNWRTNYYGIVTRGGVAEIICNSLAAVASGRYIRLRFNVTVAATAYAKIYEVAAWELTL